MLVGGTDGAHPCRAGAALGRTASHRAARRGAGRAGKRGGAGDWGLQEEPSARAGGATHAGGGLAARCSPAPQSLKAPFSRSAGSSPEEVEAT